MDLHAHGDGGGICATGLINVHYTWENRAEHAYYWLLAQAGNATCKYLQRQTQTPGFELSSAELSSAAGCQ